MSAVLMAAVTIPAAAQLSPARLNLKPGEQYRLRIRGLVVRWTTDNPAAAHVDEKGIVYARGSAFGGSAVITAELVNGRRAHTQVIVEPYLALVDRWYLRVKTAADVDRLRNQLIETIWKEEGMSTSRMPDLIEPAGDSRLPVSGAALMERLTVQMEHGVTSTSYLFSPEKPNGKLLIYCDGHSGPLENGFPAGFLPQAGYFVERGYTVLVVSMPLYGTNRTPILSLYGGPKVRLTHHDQLWQLESETLSPLKFFFEPILRCINYLEQERQLSPVGLYGHSGGGWMTVVYAAIDQRIQRSFSAAGSYPLTFRPEGLGDYEQFAPEIFNFLDYTDLYVMGAYPAGRVQVNIYTWKDPCCMKAGEAYRWEPEVKAVLAEIGGGRHDNCVDTSTQQHELTPAAMSWIYAELERAD
ncbi:MAG TPA: hypothetical protein VGF48_11450 [Thermoanaerobaculia bacterium]